LLGAHPSGSFSVNDVVFLAIEALVVVVVVVVVVIIVVVVVVVVIIIIIVVGCQLKPVISN